MFRPVLLSETLCNATRNSSVPDQLNDALYYYLCRGSYVFISVSLFVCRIMPKLVDQFSHNLMEIGMYGRICIIRHLFSSNNCAISADLAEVCALLSAILVYIKANSGFVIKTFLCYFQYCFFSLILVRSAIISLFHWSMLMAECVWHHIFLKNGTNIV